MLAFLFSFRASAHLRRLSLCALAALPASAQTTAAPPTSLAPVTVLGRAADLLGTAEAASQGSVGYVELATRPFLRRGELLEVIPGVVITQHSGGGKANQYFLRGFNLDHGTDFSLSVDGLPVNLRSHAHGQGYADLNFIIPEFVQSVDYTKGPFAADVGDFSSAGAARFSLFKTLPASFATVELGENNFARFVVGTTVLGSLSASANSTASATTLGFEATHDDGPWVLPENLRRYSAFARHTWSASRDREFSLTALASPKFGLVLGPWGKTEFYLNAGLGFHSNDARGTTIRVDPADGTTPVDRVNPLVRSRGFEGGLRTSFTPGLVSTVSLWSLDLDSELVFVGDAGGTEPSGATRRYGIEFANFYRATPWLTLDADVSFTHARYRAGAPADRIANSIGTVVTAGLVVGHTTGPFASVRLRSFGAQPLTEDNSVTQPTSTTLNARVGWKNRDWEFALNLLNALDRRSDDIAYVYTSRLRGEPLAGLEDTHLHPAEPRTLRLSATRRF